MQWKAVTAQRYQLGEAPFWDEAEQALYWVDIAGKLACRLIGTTLQSWHLPEHGSAFIPCASGDALVTLSSGVYRLDLSSPPDKPALSLFCVADPTPGNRGNEARCDVQGRLWLSTMQNNIAEDGSDLALERRCGGLFRVDPDRSVTRLLSGLGIPNTLLWSNDGATLHFADSLDEIIYHYPIAADGSLGKPRSWAWHSGHGGPDGSAMDGEGYVWNARWDGNCLLRLAPDGSIDRIIEVPVSRPTSCVFGGPDLRTLYVTSAAAGSSLDGAVLAASVEVAGLPCTRFAG